MALSVTSAPWQQVNMPALDLRRFLSAAFVEGVVGGNDMVAAQRGAGANMSVDISAGQALIQGDAITNQGLYYAYNDAVFNLAGFSAANATNPRVDRVTLRIRDQFHGDAANDISFQIVTGTATAGATLTNLNGAAAVPTSQLLLANVLIPATATTITTANIDATVRTIAGALPYGTAWQTYVPAWTTSGTAPSPGNATLTGRYTQIGKTVVGFAKLTMGSTTTFGTGAYALSLPVPARAGESGGAGFTDIFDASPAGDYLWATIISTPTTVNFYSPASPAAAATNTAPITFATGDVITARFTYEAA